MTTKIAVLAGDGVGPEIIGAAVEILKACLPVELEPGLVGGAAIEATGDPLPHTTLQLVESSDAVLLGPVGGPLWGGKVRGEEGLERLRRTLGAYVSLRPARYLGVAAPVRDSIARHADILLVRDLSDMYISGPASGNLTDHGPSLDTLRRAAHLAFRQASSRRGRLTAVDKSNYLPASKTWRDVVAGVASEYPEVDFEQRYVDTTSFEVMRAPHRFDVMLTENLFGDILSDQLAALVGSMSLLGAASLGTRGHIFRPVQDSDPAIAGRGIANPAGAILAVALMLEHALERPDLARAVEAAVAAAVREAKTLDVQGHATTAEFTRAVLRNFSWLRWSDMPEAEPARTSEWGV
jgi:3-isopropylmalate dehydrogenase